MKDGYDEMVQEESKILGCICAALYLCKNIHKESKWRGIQKSNDSRYIKVVGNGSLYPRRKTSSLTSFLYMYEDKPVD